MKTVEQFMAEQAEELRWAALDKRATANEKKRKKAALAEALKLLAWAAKCADRTARLDRDPHGIEIVMDDIGFRLLESSRRLRNGRLGRTSGKGRRR